MKKIYYGNHEHQFGELRLPEGDGPHPVAVVIHGGFWRSEYGIEQINEVAENLAENGWATWNIEYRRVGHEGGSWPGTLLDVAHATDYVRTLADTYALQLDNVVTIGHSAGGHLALWLAGRHRLPESSELHTQAPLRIKSAVSLAGVTDLRMMHKVHDIRNKAVGGEPNNPTADLLGGSPEEVANRYNEASPSALLPLDVTQVLVHGALDVHVPVGISQHYYREAEEFGDFVKLVELPNAEHFMVTDPSTEAWAEVLEEMELLK